MRSVLEQIKLYGTTASGSLTVQSTVNVIGFLEAVEWIDGTLADGVDFVLSCVRNDDAADVTLLTGTNANSDAWYYPYTPAQDNAGAAVTFDGTNEIYTKQIVNGQLKLAITSASGAQVGGCIVYVSR